MAKAKYFIFQGGPELIKYWITPDHTLPGRWWWSASKHVLPGDKAFIYLTAPQSRIVGEVDVLDKPFLNGPPYAFDNPHMHDKWCVEVGNPIYYGNRWDISMSNLRTLFSTDWGWVRYPRGNTRVPDEILPTLLELVRKIKPARPPCRRRGCVEGVIIKNDRQAVCRDCSGH